MTDRERRARAVLAELGYSVVEVSELARLRDVASCAESVAPFAGGAPASDRLWRALERLRHPERVLTEAQVAWVERHS